MKSQTKLLSVILAVGLIVPSLSLAEHPGETITTGELGVSTSAHSEKCSFIRDLAEGTEGEDVECLQKYLQSEKHLDHDVHATGFFGPLTKTAVEKWQEAKGLPHTGYFGHMSRAKHGEKHEEGKTEAGEHHNEGAKMSSHDREKLIADIMAQIKVLQAEIAKMTAGQTH